MNKHKLIPRVFCKLTLALENDPTQPLLPQHACMQTMGLMEKQDTQERGNRTETGGRGFRFLQMSCRELGHKVDKITLLDGHHR